MTLTQLIAALQALVDEHGDDLVVVRAGASGFSPVWEVAEATVASRDGGQERPVVVVSDYPTR